MTRVYADDPPCDGATREGAVECGFIPRVASAREVREVRGAIERLGLRGELGEVDSEANRGHGGRMYRAGALCAALDARACSSGA